MEPGLNLEPSDDPSRRPVYSVTLPSAPPPIDSVLPTGGQPLQIIFSFEPRSDLLDHFATIGVVY